MNILCASVVYQGLNASVADEALRSFRDRAFGDPEARGRVVGIFADRDDAAARVVVGAALMGEISVFVAVDKPAAATSGATYNYGEFEDLCALLHSCSPCQIARKYPGETRGKGSVLAASILAIALHSE